MPTRLNPYIQFEDCAREAMEFYHDALGGTLAMNTFGEYGMAGTPHENLIMHAMLETPGGIALMASDTPPGTQHHPAASISISLSGDDDDELRGYWDKLAVGGTVQIPLQKQMWGDTFGQLTDKFGIAWMVNIAGTPA